MEQPQNESTQKEPEKSPEDLKKELQKEDQPTKVSYTFESNEEETFTAEPERQEKEKERGYIVHHHVHTKVYTAPTPVFQAPAYVTYGAPVYPVGYVAPGHAHAYVAPGYIAPTYVAPSYPPSYLGRGGHYPDHHHQHQQHHGHH